jgi:PAS domain S-box-containing protein
MERAPFDGVRQSLTMGTENQAVTVLIVDDTSEVVELTAEFLEHVDDGLTVLTETSATDGLDRLATDHVDCVVSDYDMPGMNGVEFLRAVRAEHDDLPFMLFTGEGSERVASDAISAGLTDYLQKDSGPEQYELLRTRIRNAVSAYRAKREATGRLHELQQVLKTVPTAVVRVDARGEIVYANRAARENLGAEPATIIGQAGDGSGLNITDVDGEPIPEEELPFRQVLDSGEPIENYRHTVLGEDRERRTLEVNGTPLFGDDGAVESVMLCITDVTDEISRIRELERYETFLEYSPDFITVLDESGRINYRSSTPEGVDGSEPLSVAGERAAEHIHPDDREHVQSDFERVLTRGPEEMIRTEFRVKGADGEYRWFENRATNYIGTDPVDGVLIASRDITHRKETEEYLAAYATTLTQLQECTQDLLETTELAEAADVAIAGLERAFDFDIAGLWLSNDERTALEPVAITDRGEELIETPPAYSAEASSLSWDAFESGRARVVTDMTDHEDRYNDETPIRSEMVAPLGEYGVLNIGHTDGSMFDDQDLKRVTVWANLVESTLARLDQIERLQDRERELQRERDRLDEFASFVSHDLRNPLNVASLRLDLASGEGENPHLDAIERALDRMERLIDDLLALARQGSTVGETEPVQLRQLLSRCWSHVENDGAELTVRTDRTIRADGRRLTNVIENILRNAVEHGGEEITVGTMGEADGIYVADDGPGIPEGERDRIFEGGYSTSEHGSGLGLAIVGRIVDAHGWTIEATESAEGGARFEITDVEFVE